MRKSSKKTDLWLPASYDDLNNLPRDTFLFIPRWGSKVVRTQPGVVIKYIGNFDEEVNCMTFARRHLSSVRIPRVLHHPGNARNRAYWNPLTIPKVWYLCMEEIPGQRLEDVIGTMTETQLRHIASQLRALLDEMKSIKSRTLGSVTGGPFRNQYFFLYVLEPRFAWENTAEFINHYRALLNCLGNSDYTEKILSPLPCNSAIRFSHGDLVPKNIIVDGSTITGVVDWAMAGFYPEFWEYCRMHVNGSSSSNWDTVLDLVFPTPRRVPEIMAVTRLFNILTQ
ncbi:kinase-like domain-containing protein [Armillaria luteobubalina]|uniref:Kinase-like domain-containing protein n=1 Tax=Armillaria luteobubalina TaxID=153913 RepID=A0AA39QKR9_9AGAR|nr:kinase-like domain-containing protein [Armillaria luteobubalina]